MAALQTRQRGAVASVPSAVLQHHFAGDGKEGAGEGTADDFGTCTWVFRARR